jgi:hypothetical protein
MILDTVNDFEQKVHNAVIGSNVTTRIIIVAGTNADTDVSAFVIFGGQRETVNDDNKRPTVTGDGTMEMILKLLSIGSIVCQSCITVQVKNYTSTFHASNNSVQTVLHGFRSI